jgi:hypothetical protein
MNFYTTYNQTNFSLQSAKSGILATEMCLECRVSLDSKVRAHVFGLAEVKITSF